MSNDPIALSRSEDPVLLRSMLDAIPSFVFVVDDDVRILDYNAAAAGLLGEDRPKVLRHRAGDLLHCIHSMDAPEGCGHGKACSTCVIRGSVRKALTGSQSVRSRAKMELKTGEKVAEIYVLISTSGFDYNGSKRVMLVVEDISQIMELQQIIPICMYCKKVRTDDQYWHRVEAYFGRRWDVNFSHGLCPDCEQVEMAKLS